MEKHQARPTWVLPCLPWSLQMANQDIIQQCIPVLYWQQFIPSPYSVCPTDLFSRTFLLHSWNSCSAATCDTVLWDTCFSLTLVHICLWAALPYRCTSLQLFCSEHFQWSHTLKNIFHDVIYQHRIMANEQKLSGGFWTYHQNSNRTMTVMQKCVKEHQRSRNLITFSPAEEYFCLLVYQYHWNSWRERNNLVQKVKTVNQYNVKK